MKVSAIVVTFNGEVWIEKCLNSLINNTIPISIIVIDNASSDRTVEIIRTRFPKIDLIENQDNLGFGQANNIGIRKALELEADTNYFFLLNQDAWLNPDTVERLISISHRHSQYGILSPMHLNCDQSEIDFNFSEYLAPSKCPRLYSDLYLGHMKDVYSLEFANAAAWLLTRPCVEKVGFFDPIFFHYGEDDNYCQRVLFHGFDIGICPGLSIVHDRGLRKRIRSEHEKYLHMRRMRLLLFCDIRNTDFRRNYYRCLLKTTLEGVAHFLQFKFKAFQLNMNEVVYFIKIKKEIRKSRAKNSASVHSYL